MVSIIIAPIVEFGQTMYRVYKATSGDASLNVVVTIRGASASGGSYTLAIVPKPNMGTATGTGILVGGNVDSGTGNDYTLPTSLGLTGTSASFSANLVVTILSTETVGDEITLTLSNPPSTSVSSGNQHKTTTITIATATSYGDYRPTLPVNLTVRCHNTSATMNIALVRDIPDDGGETLILNLGTLTDLGLKPGTQTITIITIDNALPPIPSGPILIENLEQLHAIRYDMDDGNGRVSSTHEAAYKAAFPRLSQFNTYSGYTLSQNLDFNDDDSYENAVQNKSRWTMGGGWPPMGNSGSQFLTVFNGKGYSISNLYASGGGHVGLFGYIGSSGVVRNLGLESPYVARTLVATTRRQRILLLF